MKSYVIIRKGQKKEKRKRMKIYQNRKGLKKDCPFARLTCYTSFCFVQLKNMIYKWTQNGQLMIQIFFNFFNFCNFFLAFFKVPRIFLICFNLQSKRNIRLPLFCYLSSLCLSSRSSFLSIGSAFFQTGHFTIYIRYITNYYIRMMKKNNKGLCDQECMLYRCVDDCDYY